MNSSLIAMLSVVYMLSSPTGEPVAEVQVLRWTTPKQCEEEVKERNGYGLLNETMPDGRRIEKAYYACTLVDAQFAGEDMGKAIAEKAQGL